MYTSVMKQLYYSFLIFAASVPLAVFAQGVADDGSRAGQTPNGCGGDLNFCLQNPLRFNTLESLIVGILNVLLVIAVPIIVFFIIFAGFSYVTAQGNPEKIKQASRSLTYAIIGGVLILGAVAISEILQNVVESFSSESAVAPDDASVNR